MECLGGAGYVEESILPRIYRQSPLNSIWEGSGNVICLDVLRALQREPESAAALLEELERARGAYAVLDAAIDDVKRHLTTGHAGEASARRLVGLVAQALQGALLARHAPSAVADGFCATRLGEAASTVYGAFAATLDTDALVARALPLERSAGLG
jgi:putative acyl-CoA dehydrogenase